MHHSSIGNGCLLYCEVCCFVLHFLKSCQHNRRCLKVQLVYLVPCHQLTRISTYYRKPFVHSWKIRWKFFLQHCRKMRWLWLTQYGKVSRHVLPLKRAHTSSQVACDDSSGSLHKKCRNMAREACTAQVVVASPSQSDREGADDDVSLLDHTDSFSDPEQLAVPTLSTLDRATADFEVEETTTKSRAHAKNSLVA